MSEERLPSKVTLAICRHQRRKTQPLRLQCKRPSPCAFAEAVLEAVAMERLENGSEWSHTSCLWFLKSMLRAFTQTRLLRRLFLAVTSTHWLFFLYFIFLANGNIKRFA